VIKSITAITVDGSEIDLESFTFDIGTDIQETYALNKKEFHIADYKPTMKVTAIKTKGNSTHWSELNNNTKKAVVVTLGDTAGNIIELSAPYCAPYDVSENDNNFPSYLHGSSLGSFGVWVGGVLPSYLCDLLVRYSLMM